MNGDRAAWGDILGSPSFDTRLLNVTVGIDGEPPLSTATGGPVSLKLTVLAWPPVLAAGALFVALLIGFFLLMRHSNILRDATPPEDAVAIVNGKLDPSKAVTNRGTYSLAKLQAAWWFFIFIGAYLLIGIVTWDFYSSVSSTALILLGIGAGTVVGGTLIDTSKDTSETADAGAKRAVELKSRILLLDAAQEYCHLFARRLDVLDPPSASPRPLTPEEDVRLHALTNLYGPNMVQWLRAGFGAAYTTIADIFELQTLNQADEAQAAALTGGAARPALSHSWSNCGRPMPGVSPIFASSRHSGLPAFRLRRNLPISYPHSLISLRWYRKCPKSPLRRTRRYPGIVN